MARATKAKALPSLKARAKMIRDVKPDDPLWFERSQGETLAQVIVWTVNQAPPDVRHAMFAGALLYLTRAAGEMKQSAPKDGAA